MRHPNEQSGSSSLFAHPTAIAPVPLEDTPLVRLAVRDELESRLDNTLQSLQAVSAATAQQTVDHLCLFSRWYHRPQARRVGEAIFVESTRGESHGEIPRKPLLRAISRVYRQGQSSTEQRAEDTSGVENLPAEYGPPVEK
jgi:hypothetical protein